MREEEEDDGEDDDNRLDDNFKRSDLRITKKVFYSLPLHPLADATNASALTMEQPPLPELGLRRARLIDEMQATFDYFYTNGGLSSETKQHRDLMKVQHHLVVVQNPSFTISVEDLISTLHISKTREQAAYHLSRCRSWTVSLAPILWKSFRTITTLLEEIVPIYRILLYPDLVARASTQIVNVLALLD